MGLALMRPEPFEALKDIYLDDACPESTLKIGSSLSPELQGALIILLKEFHDVFVYSFEEMPRIDPEIVVHWLNVDPNMKLIR